MDNHQQIKLGKGEITTPVFLLPAFYLGKTGKDVAAEQFAGGEYITGLVNGFLLAHSMPLWDILLNLNNN
jgi:hypothetical protein